MLILKVMKSEGFVKTLGHKNTNLFLFHDI